MCVCVSVCVCVCVLCEASSRSNVSTSQQPLTRTTQECEWLSQKVRALAGWRGSRGGDVDRPKLVKPKYFSPGGSSSMWSASFVLLLPMTYVLSEYSSRHFHSPLRHAL